MEKLLPYVVSLGVVLNGCTYSVNEPDGNTTRPNISSNKTPPGTESLEEVVTSTKAGISTQLESILNLKLVHLDYATVDFEKTSFELLPTHLLEKLDDSRRRNERSITIPNAVEDQWIKEALKMNDIIKSYMQVVENRNRYDGPRDSEQLQEFNASLLSKLKEKSHIPLRDLSITDSLDLVFKTAMRILRYREVDEGKFKINGMDYNAYSFDNQVASGVGDCNIYAALATYLFDLLKKENTRLQNIYVGESHFGIYKRHIWTQIYFKEGDALYIASTSLSEENIGRKSNISKEPYLSPSSAENSLEFLRFLLDYKNETMIKPRYLKAREEARQFHKRRGTITEFKKRLSLLEETSRVKYW